MKCTTGRSRYHDRMPTLTLSGVSYEYLTPKSSGLLEETQSWEYGHWPRVEAQVPLAGGGTVTVYAEAMRWTARQILARWQDGAGHYHAAWLPKGNVRRLTASEWDIVAFHACPPELRSVQWANRLPGFLPE